MPYSPELSNLIINLLNVNPSQHSLNEHFELTAKRTGWEKLIGRLIHLITFGLCAKNPQLDRAARKAAICAEEIFKGTVPTEEQKRLVRAFSNFLDVLAKNDGSESKKIRTVIHRIQAMSAAGDPPLVKPVAQQDRVQPIVHAVIPVVPSPAQVAQPVVQLPMPAPSPVPVAPAQVPEPVVQLPKPAPVAPAQVPKPVVQLPIQTPSPLTPSPALVARPSVQLPMPAPSPTAPVTPSPAQGAGPVAKTPVAAPQPPVKSASATPEKIAQSLLAAPDQDAFDTLVRQDLRTGQDGELLFRNVLNLLTKHPQGEAPLLRLMAANLHPVQTRLLLETLMTSHRSLLARHFDNLPPSNRLFTAEQVLNLVEALDLTEPAVQPLLATYAAFLGTYQYLPSDLIQQHMPAIFTLFETGNTDFQAQITYKMMHRYNYSFQKEDDHFEKCCKASPEVWAKVASKWPPETQIYDRHDVFKKHLSHEAILAFLNALATKPACQNDDRKDSFSPFVSYLPVERLLGLSPAAIAFVDVTRIDWKRLLSDLKDPGQETQKRWLTTIVKSIVKKDQDSPLWGFDYKLLQALSPDQILQLTWTEYPRWMFFLFALRTSKLPDHAQGLRKMCPLLTLEEQKKLIDCYLKLGGPSLMEFVLTLVDPNLEEQPPILQTLMIEALNDPNLSENELQKIPLASLNFAEVSAPLARIRLLRMLPPLERREAINNWQLHHLRCDINRRDLVADQYPIAKIIEATEDPNALASFIFTTLGNNLTGKWLAERIAGHPDTWAIHEVFTELEKSPWKLRAALLRGSFLDLDTQTLGRWEEGRRKYPTCFGLLEQYQPACEFSKEMNNAVWKTDVVANKISRRVVTFQIQSHCASHPGWQKGWNALQKAGAGLKDFLLAHLRNSSPEGLARSFQVTEKSRGALFAAVFDEQARDNILLALGTGLAPLTAYLHLNFLVEQMALSEHLPQVAKDQAAHFANELASYRSIGGSTCYLQKQYHRPDFSDLTVQMDQEQILVHRPLIQLDPFFSRFAIQNNILQVPVDQSETVRSRLKCLYGVLNHLEMGESETKKILEEFHLQKLSLAALKNPPAGPGVVTLIVEDREINAHRFVLACGLPYFEACFRSGMKEASAERLRIENLTADQVQVVLESVYTGQMPNFADDISKQAFTAAIDYFLQAGKPPLVEPAADSKILK